MGAILLNTETIQVSIATNKEELEAIKKLFLDYGQSRNFDGAMGNFQYEIDNLPYRYHKPSGTLLLLKYQGQAAGCVAVQDLDGPICEMKRLYLDPEYRGLGLGKILINLICQQAINLGYQKMRLDTFRVFESAVAAYQKMGFYEIPPYQKYEMDHILFFEKVLI